MDTGRKVKILICSMVLGLMLTGCMVVPEILQTETADVAAQAEPVKTYAWWSLTYETPNPEKLPVKVRFQWLKGLE